MLHAVEYSCSKIKIHRNARTSRRTRKILLHDLATPTLNSFQHALRMEKNYQVEKAFVPRAAFTMAALLKRKRYLWLLQATKRSDHPETCTCCTGPSAFYRRFSTATVPHEKAQFKSTKNRTYVSLGLHTQGMSAVKYLTDTGADANLVSRYSRIYNVDPTYTSRVHHQEILNFRSASK